MKLFHSSNKHLFSQAAKAGVLVVTAAVILEAASLIQYYFTRRGLQEEAAQRAESELKSTRNAIMDVIDQAEAAVRNSVWIAQWCLNFQDSLPRVSMRIVEDNPVVLGSTVALVPGYSRHYPLYAPYAFLQGDSLLLRSLATPEYDYPSQEWFTQPLELGEEYWSEPYVDTGGGEVLMTTFSTPIKDLKGRPAAVLTADVSLDWLTDLMEHSAIYPNANSLMISRSGRFMVSTTRELMVKQSLLSVVDQIRNCEDFMALDRAMKAGESGKKIVKYNHKSYYIFYAPVERTGWAMCIIVPEDDIFKNVRRTIGLVTLFQLLGLALLILIIRSFVKSQYRYTKLNENRERMLGELHIASNIQMAMVPTVFPERKDLDMAATIVPAKEVGGDLYDFFIRGEKLFFCIGDVSGKGIPASLVMAVTRTSFRNLSAMEDSPGRIVTAMNDSLSAMNDNNMFVTFFCGTLDLEKGHLRYCNAGHNPPLILTTDIQSLPVEPNLPLGILPGMAFLEQEIDIRPDDALLLYTDGLSEAENLAHEQFGEMRMKEALHGKKAAAEHLETIKQKVSQFVGEAPQSDDLTIFFIHYMPIVHHITLANEIGQISLLPAFVEKVGRKAGLDASSESALNLALEEAVTNVILYAYPEGTYGPVDIDARIESGTLSFTIVDGGKAFDPTAKAEVDITAGVEDRPIGGLGIHLVRQIMDLVSYERKDGKNYLTLTKNI